MSTIHTAMTVTVRRNAIEWVATCDAMPGWNFVLGGTLTEHEASMFGLAAAFDERAHRTRAVIDVSVPRDPHRCAVCGFRLSATREDGCVRGDCSMRPVPREFFDPKRATEETR